MKKEGIFMNIGDSRLVFLKAFLIEAAVSLGFIFLFAVGMTLLETGFQYAALFATLSVAAGTFSASFYLAKKSKKNGWLFGLAVGGITFLVLTAIALAVNRDGVTMTTLFRFIILMLCALIGGILGVGKADSHRYL